MAYFNIHSPASPPIEAWSSMDMESFVHDIAPSTPTYHTLRRLQEFPQAQKLYRGANSPRYDTVTASEEPWLPSVEALSEEKQQCSKFQISYVGARETSVQNSFLNQPTCITTFQSSFGEVVSNDQTLVKNETYSNLEPSVSWSLDQQQCYKPPETIQNHEHSDYNQSIKHIAQLDFSDLLSDEIFLSKDANVISKQTEENNSFGGSLSKSYLPVPNDVYKPNSGITTQLQSSYSDAELMTTILVDSQGNLVGYLTEHPQKPKYNIFSNDPHSQKPLIAPNIESTASSEILQTQENDPIGNSQYDANSSFPSSSNDLDANETKEGITVHYGGEYLVPLRELKEVNCGEIRREGQGNIAAAENQPPRKRGRPPKDPSKAPSTSNKAANKKSKPTTSFVSSSSSTTGIDEEERKKRNNEASRTSREKKNRENEQKKEELEQLEHEVKALEDHLEYLKPWVKHVQTFICTGQVI